MADDDQIRSYLVDFNGKSTGIFMSEVHSGPDRRLNKVIVPRPMGGRMHKDSYRKVTSNQILVRASQFGPAKFRQLDGGSPITLVSRAFMTKWFPDVPLHAQLSHHQPIAGIAEGATISLQVGAWLELFLPLTDSAEAKIEVYAKVLDVCPPGLLIGNDVCNA